MEMGQEIIDEYTSLEGNRLTLDGMFRDTAYYFQPALYDHIVCSNRGGQDPGRYDTPADTMGLDMVNTLASYLVSNTVSTGSRWFTLRAASEDMNENEEVADFYAKLTDITLKAIQNSNFSLKFHENLRMATTLGTGIIGSEYDVKEQKLNYNILRISDCVIAENAQGSVDTLFYKMQLTPLQAVELYGEENLPEDVKKNLHDVKKCHTLEYYIKGIKPRQKYNKESLLKKDMPYQDIVVHESSKEMVQEGGYIEFPYSIHRFDHVDGTPYGRSPAMNALGTISMLNRMLSDYIDGVELTLQPPVFLPDGAEDVSLSPGAVNQYDASVGGRPYWMQLGIDLNGTLELIQRYQQQLKDIFYIDKFVALENARNMTATEVVERVSEKIQAISPVVSRMQSELLEPLIERTVRLLVENNRGPKIPDSLLVKSEDEEGAEGNEFKVVYTTRLDAKLAEVDTDNLMMALEQASGFLAKMQEIPELETIMNTDKVIKMIMRNNNVSPDMTKSSEEIEEIRLAIAEQNEENRAMEMASQIMKPVDPNKPMENEMVADLIQ